MTNLNLFTQSPLGTEIKADEILEAFSFLDDWEERYSYIIELGNKHPPFPDSEKTEANLVHGCQSQVWLLHHYDTASNRIYFLIESDAMIVRGLAAIILTLLNTKSPQELATIDVENVFGELDLFRHISPTRGNGLRAMLKKIKNLATSLE
ncbi:MAG: Fe-S metabolism protein SufE [Gammaproteobacteria bacterium]|nr:MAG: Fe-S metabolism protein SufE [Gammaproteobacteria bacterium]